MFEKILFSVLWISVLEAFSQSSDEIDSYQET